MQPPHEGSAAPAKAACWARGRRRGRGWPRPNRQRFILCVEEPSFLRVAGAGHSFTPQDPKPLGAPSTVVWPGARKGCGPVSVCAPGRPVTLCLPEHL